MIDCIRKRPYLFYSDCPVPASPNDGNVEFTGRASGSQATYDCHRGFNVAGRDRRTCIITGEWEGTEPSCESMLNVHVHNASK